MAVQSVRADSVLDFSHDWSAWLTGTDTVAVRNWTVEPAGPALVNQTAATVMAGPGFVEGTVYRLQEKITTSAGRVAVRQIILRCIA